MVSMIVSVGDRQEDTRVGIFTGDDDYFLYAISTLRAMVPQDLRSEEDEIVYVMKKASRHLDCWLRFIAGEFRGVNVIFTPHFHEDSPF